MTWHSVTVTINLLNQQKPSSNLRRKNCWKSTVQISPFYSLASYVEKLFKECYVNTCGINTLYLTKNQTNPTTRNRLCNAFHRGFNWSTTKEFSKPNSQEVQYNTQSTTHACVHKKIQHKGVSRDSYSMRHGSALTITYSTTISHP